jgi:hypothetical protein
MNQQGTLSGPPCESSQNGRGGLFCAVQYPQLLNSVRDLLSGPDSATIRLVEMRSGNTPSTADFTIPMVPELCSTGLVGCRLQ